MPRADALALVIGGEPCIGSLAGRLAELARASSDAAIAELAVLQHGVVARAQLVALGIGPRAIEHRLAGGRLHRIHRGVYAVGHTVLTAKGRWLAAVLASGAGAVLSYRSAAALWDVRAASGATIDVTAARGRRGRPGIRLHCDRLAPDEVTVVDGIPVTTVPRTLLDLAAVVDRGGLERAATRAEQLRLSDPLSLGDLVARHRRRPGTPALRELLAAGRVGGAATRSELESRFLALLDRLPLPRPEVNLPIELGDRWIEADFAWPGERLIVELDGRATHATVAAFESDRARDRAAAVAGWRVIRVTWRQLHDGPRGLARDLERLLGSPAPQAAIS